MNAFIFNFLQKVNQVKDALVQQGPTALRKTVNILQLLEDAANRAADYIDQFGSSEVIPQGAGAQYNGGVDHPEAQQHLAELKEVLDLANAEMAKLSAPSPQSGLLSNLLGKIDPATKKAIWGLLSGLITQVLTKSGLGGAILGAVAGGTTQAPPQAVGKHPKQ